MDKRGQKIADRNLLLLLIRGDEAAFEEIYHLYKAQILHNVLKLVRNEAIAAELHQDIFLRLWQYRENIDVDRPLSSYLVTIAKNVAIDFYKKAAKEKQLQQELLWTMDIEHQEEEAWMDYKETHDILESIIERLPPQRKQVYRLIKLEHKTYEEAASYFGVSVGTIKDHMAKAARFVQKEFGRPNQSVWVIAFVQAVLSAMKTN